MDNVDPIKSITGEDARSLYTVCLAYIAKAVSY
jgi:hypothetical protein